MMTLNELQTLFENPLYDDTTADEIKRILGSGLSPPRTDLTTDYTKQVEEIDRRIKLSEEQCSLLIEIVSVWDTLPDTRRGLTRDTVKQFIITQMYDESDKDILNSVRESYKKYLIEEKERNECLKPLSKNTDPMDAIIAVMGIPKSCMGKPNDPLDRFSNTKINFNSSVTLDDLLKY